jgi:hypothetical protein
MLTVNVVHLFLKLAKMQTINSKIEVQEENLTIHRFTFKGFLQFFL